jgi:energy-coupling factor transporter transmembrane protein EcfT
MDDVSNIFKVIMPLLGGILFIVSYVFSEKNEFFNLIAHFPRKRKGSIKIGSLIFGLVFLIIAIYNYLITF